MMPNIITESASGYQFLDISDTLLKKRKIFFTSEVNAHSCNELLKQLMYLECDDNSKEVTLYINSPGGEVTSGLAVYDFMRIMKSPIKTVCIGTAASMGSILFLAGNERIMMPHSSIMIHDPSFSGGSCSYAGMKPLQIQEKIDELMKTRKELCNIIAERTGKTEQEIFNLTKKDTYFEVDEAIKFGIATGKYDKIDIND